MMTTSASGVAAGVLVLTLWGWWYARYPVAPCLAQNTRDTPNSVCEKGSDGSCREPQVVIAVDDGP